MSANATIELRAADFYRGQASIIQDIEKIVKPLLAQQQYVADSDSCIMSLRMQITGKPEAASLQMSFHSLTSLSQHEHLAEDRPWVCRPAR